MTSLLDAAVRYTNAGLAAIPLWPDHRKNPHLNQIGEYSSRLPTLLEWRRWARQWPNANIGLITGYWQNLVCLDFDDMLTFDVWVKDVANQPGTWMVTTARGVHVWFKTACEPGTSRIYTKDGLEVLLRAKGGYCIVPPSVHWSGKPYQTAHKCLPRPISEPEEVLPGWKIKFEAPDVPRIRPSIIIKPQKVKIEDLIPPISKHPNYRGAYLARCPFHDDQTPSAWINIDEQKFGCNACWPGMWWDVINVYAMLRQISNGEAFKVLTGKEKTHA